MPERRYHRKRDGKGCDGCWANRLKHANGRTKKWMQQHPEEAGIWWAHYRDMETDEDVGRFDYKKVSLPKFRKDMDPDGWRHRHRHLTL